MEQFIYLQKNSIPEELCDDIIDLFEKEKQAQYLGVTGGGYTKNVKETIDFGFPDDNDYNDRKHTQIIHLDKWTKIKDFLYKELHKNLKIYIEMLNKHFNVVFMDKNVKITDKGFLLHKYIKGEGKFTRHHDFVADNNRYRIIVYLWYLNDVEEGGQTQVFDHIKIKPEKGKLLMFPAQWCYPHCGLKPLSNDKYVITGWFHLQI